MSSTTLNKQIHIEGVSAGEKLVYMLQLQLFSQGLFLLTVWHEALLYCSNHAVVTEKPPTVIHSFTIACSSSSKSS